MEALINAYVSKSGASVSSAPRGGGYSTYAAIFSIVLSQIIPWKNPYITWLVRVAFLAMTGLKYLVWSTVSARIQYEGEALSYPRYFLKPSSQGILAMVLGKSADGAFGSSPENYVCSSYLEHETAIADGELQSIFQSAIALAVSLLFGVNYMLVSGIIMTPLRLLESPTVYRWMFDSRNDKSPYGDLAEDPAVSPPGLQSVIASGSASTELVAAARAAHSKQGYDFDMEHAIYSAWEDQQDPVLFGAWERLREAGKPADYRTATHGWSVLMVAAGSPPTDAATVRDLALKLGCDLAARDSTGWTALHWAAFHGSYSGAEGVMSACLSKDGFCGTLTPAGGSAGASTPRDGQDGVTEEMPLCPTATEVLLARDSEGYSAVGLAAREAKRLEESAAAAPAGSLEAQLAGRRSTLVTNVLELLRWHARRLLRAALDTADDVERSLEGLEMQRKPVVEDQGGVAAPSEAPGGLEAGGSSYQMAPGAELDSPDADSETDGELKDQSDTSFDVLDVE